MLTTSVITMQQQNYADTILVTPTIFRIRRLVV